jgi:N-acetylglucosaminyldiphosphoundecaprenol N-acetyl-beta-D-mannosaminyltransferase
METALQQGGDRSHFFYGSSEETLSRLVAAARELAPDIRIAGSYSPPFKPTTDDDLQSDTTRIRESGADFVWVGLGMPKQELWMRRAADYLPGAVLLGVGAAFDFIAGTTPRAPAWMQSAGLEWLHRFGQQPGRLWRRYLVNNPAFMALLAAQVIRRKTSRSN